MACGEYGEGKMSEPEKIVNELVSYLKNLGINNKLKAIVTAGPTNCLLYTSPSPRDATLSRMPSSA